MSTDTGKKDKYVIFWYLSHWGAGNWSEAHSVKLTQTKCEGLKAQINTILQASLDICTGIIGLFVTEKAARHECAIRTGLP